MPIERPRRACRDLPAKRARRSVSTAVDDEKCCFCGITGSQRACQGALLGPFTVKRQAGRGAGTLKVYAHRNCAIWAPEVWEDCAPETGDVRVMGMEDAYKRSRRSRCMVCKATGASLACVLKGKACCRNMHFYCALVAGAVLLPWTAYTVLCPKHSDRNIEGDFEPYAMRMRHAQTPIPPALLDASTAPYCNKCEEDNYKLESGALLVCGKCGTATHARCLDPPILRDGEAAVKASQKQFRCEQCEECQKCHGNFEEPTLSASDVLVCCCSACSDRGFKYCRCGAHGDHLTCILCRSSFHRACVDSLPQKGEPFRCPACRICTHCEKLDMKKWDESLEACGVCSARHALGHICPACSKVYPEEDTEPMVWCDYCLRWFHGQCAGLDNEAFIALEHSDEKWSCLSCTEDIKVAESAKVVKRRINRAKKKRRNGRPPKDCTKSASVQPKPKGRTRKDSQKSPSVEVNDEKMNEVSSKEDEFSDEILPDTPTGLEIVFNPSDGNQRTLGSKVAPTIDLCFLCGSGGPLSSFRFCYDCGEAYHGFCLTPPLPMREVKPRTNSLGTLYRLNSGGCGIDSLPWRCWRCVRCEICTSSASDPPILMCDHCDRGFNPKCLKPPLREVPEGTFTCPECSICDLCRTPASLPVRIHDRIFCSRCAITIRQSSPCPVCYIKYPSFPLHSQEAGDFSGIRALARECSACRSVVHEDCDSMVISMTNGPYVCACCRGEPIRMSEVSDHEPEKTLENSMCTTDRFQCVIGSPSGAEDHQRVASGKQDSERTMWNEAIGFESDLGAVKRDWEIGTDWRKCYLCGDQEGPSNEQRLLPWGSQLSIKGDLWVHASCALWSNEFELSDEHHGLLCVNRLRLAQQMKKNICIECSSPGATLVCAVLECNTSYHYPCAVKQLCCFVVTTKDGARKRPGFPVPLADVKDVFLLCPYHTRMQHGSDESDDQIMSVSDQVDLACPLRLEVPTVSARKALPPNAGVRVGSLTAVRIGKLMPQSDAFLVKEALIPSGYVAIRRYWSYRNPGERTEYVFEISGDDITGPRWSITVADDSAFKVETSSATEAWRAVQRRLLKGRLTTTAEDAFGAASVRGVISLIEGLPFASLFGGRYKFWYVHPDNPMRVKPLPRLFENTTGSARTEGYIPRRLLLREPWRKADPPPPTYDNAPTGRMYQFDVAMEQSEKIEMPGRSKKLKLPFSLAEDTNGCLHGTIGTTVAKLPYAMQYRQMRKTWRRRTHVLRSNIEGWGVFAAEDIPPNEMVIEYAGELVRPSVSDLREAQYEEKGKGCYLFRIQRSDLIVDATMKGSNARFINHSCDPNCFSKTVTIEPGRRVIVIFTKRWVSRGEELTYDYLFDFEEGEDRQPCKCGSIDCRQWMN